MVLGSLCLCMCLLPMSGLVTKGRIMREGEEARVEGVEVAMEVEGRSGWLLVLFMLLLICFF